MTTHLIRRTSTEEFHFDPATIAEHFGDMLDAWTGSYEDFIIGLFEEHDGSMFGGRFFSDTTNTSVGCEVITQEDES